MDLITTAIRYCTQGLAVMSFARKTVDHGRGHSARRAGVARAQTVVKDSGTVTRYDNAARAMEGNLEVRL